MSSPTTTTTTISESTETVKNNKYELIYWPIRGRCSPIRAALTFGNINFTDNRMSDWDDENGTRARLINVNKFALANLPALILPDETVLTQTRTVLQYAATLSPELTPKNNIDAANVSMILDHLNELYDERVKMSYGEEAAANIPSFFESSVPYYFGTVESWITTRKTEFVATNYITVADMFLVEFICAFEKLKQGLGWMEKYPKLLEVYGKVTSHPKLKEYYEKEKSTPFNDPIEGAWS